MTRQNIPGIYNYCDRWCERCTFTSRCAIYEHETDLSPEERDLTNKAFWDRIGQNFAKAQELIAKAVAEHGIDLGSAETQTSIKSEAELKEESRKHPLAVLSLDYSKVGRDWLKTQPGMLNRLETLKTELELGVTTEDRVRKETAAIGESIAVIQWYLVLIYTRLSQALMGRAVKSLPEEDDTSQRDCDGSAKIAIIAIERSMSAWSALFDILPEDEDHFLQVLSMLEKIKSLAKKEFPAALNFIRPGFDA